MPLIATAKFPTAAASAADLLNFTNWLDSYTAPTLAAELAAAATSATLTAGTGAQLPLDNFTVSIENEILFVGSRTDDTISSLTRGTEGTSDATHAAGKKVNHFLTALSHNQLAAEIAALEAWKAWRTHVDRPPVTPNAADDEFDSATLDTSKWTWRNQHNATATLSRSILTLTASNNSENQLNAITEPLPEGDWTFRAKVCPVQFTYSRAQGLILYETATTKYLAIYIMMDGYPTYIRTGYQTGLANPPTQINYSSQNWQIPVYLQLQRTGTTLTLGPSIDGSNFYNQLQESQTTHFTTAPDAAGIVTGDTAYSAIAINIDWFRRIA